MILQLKASSPDNADAKSVCIDGTFSRVDTNAASTQVDPGFVRIYKKPDKPVEDGLWGIEVSCPSGGKFNGNLVFLQGRHAGSFQNGFANDLTMSYVSDGKILLNGYLGPDPIAVDFTAIKGADSKFTGPGKWGSTSCITSIQFINNEIHHPILRAPAASTTFDRETDNIEIKCGNTWYNSFKDITFIRGLASFGYFSKTNYLVTAQLRITYEQGASKGRLYGNLMSPDTDVIDIPFSYSQTVQGQYLYTGWGTVGNIQNCGLTLYSSR